MFKAAIRIRVATRFFGTGSDVAGFPDAIGGRVIKGESVSSTVAEGASDWISAGTAATGVVKESRPATRNVIPSAVRMAGMIRVRIPVAKEAMGRAS